MRSLLEKENPLKNPAIQRIILRSFNWGDLKISTFVIILVYKWLSDWINGRIGVVELKNRPLQL